MPVVNISIYSIIYSTITHIQFTAHVSTLSGVTSISVISFFRDEDIYATSMTFFVDLTCYVTSINIPQ